MRSVLINFVKLFKAYVKFNAHRSVLVIFGKMFSAYGARGFEQKFCICVPIGETRPVRPRAGRQNPGPLWVLAWLSRLIAEPIANPREKWNYYNEDEYQPINDSKFIIEETTEKSTTEPSEENNCE